MEYGTKEDSMKAAIKMMGLDLDGTVLNEEKKISVRTRQAIIKAIKKGVVVLPATGRPMTGIPEEILKIEGIQYALSANGASVAELSTGKRIHEDCMDYKACADIIKKLEALEVMTDVFLNGRGYSDKKTFEENTKYAPSEAARNYLLSSRKVVDNLPQYLNENKFPVEKITVNFRTEETGALHHKAQVLDILKKYSGLAVVCGVPTNLEITNCSATKGNGLLALGKYLGIGRESIMVCGDSENDLEMIKTAGFGVAMENSPKQVKEAADFITLSNEEDGVAYAIERYVLS